ncbi:hypothetical protein C8J57DRAFT_1276856 [Mycena rebaudengoi]|nr:hypothetical protein C8J57DRAFT_1276856 [Mycena rebaudengoi]
MFTHTTDWPPARPISSANNHISSGFSPQKVPLATGQPPPPPPGDTGSESDSNRLRRRSFFWVLLLALFLLALALSTSSEKVSISPGVSFLSSLRPPSTTAQRSSVSGPLPTFRGPRVSESWSSFSSRSRFISSRSSPCTTSEKKSTAESATTKVCWRGQRVKSTSWTCAI